MHCRLMKLPSPAAFCLVVGVFIAALLWLLGDRTAAIGMFVVEAFGWAAIYKVSASKAD